MRLSVKVPPRNCVRSGAWSSPGDAGDRLIDDSAHRMRWSGR
ncbi:hypothetical protein STRIP9103_07155 [Streptomyces ipomoeae 91-03]|uniref:Uncharacterized protein n=1 Tax=Streptomyces ipomoeae 91-03 TaxID=698759 RepID=L1KQU7_9ACTN|nr:hypothetical protein STRIP9103_07155 [Streptomyces ipomoeae 91-03]